MRVLNLGAGVQSTTVFLMALRGEVPAFDHVIFADTQDEPAAVYAHLRWLQGLGGPPIHVVTAGRIGDDLMRAVNTTGQRFAAIPAYGHDGVGQVGMMRRQCSKEYKTEVIAKTIRRTLLGLAPRAHVPRGHGVTQAYGISLDEARRARSIRERSPRWSTPEFPLLDRFMTRADCLTWLARAGVPHPVPKSSCVFCPYHSDAQWAELKATDPEGWARAVAVDDAIREKRTIATRGLRQVLYLHRSCIPLRDVTLKPTARDAQMAMSFYQECEGVCGV